MEKLVLIIGKAAKDAAQVASEIDSLPGVSVTASSQSMIDVEVSEPAATEALRSYASRHGFEVEPMPDAQLIEPISPFKAR